VLDEILTSRHGNTFHKVAVDQAWHGWTVGRIYAELKATHEAVLVGLERTSKNGDDGDEGIIVNPPSELTVEADDVLLLISASMS